MLQVIVLAILPAFILLFLTNQQDKLQREPTKNLVKAFFYGCLSVLASLLISIPSMPVFQRRPRTPDGLSLQWLPQP